MPASQFFSQWKNAVVLIAPRDSARPLALLEGLRELISWKRIPLSVQGAAGLMCAVILLAGRTRFLLKNRRNAALALAGATLLAWIVGLRFGVIVPLLPAGLTILFLFLQRPVRGPRERTA